MDNQKIGQFIKELRIKDGVSQKAIADICNVSHQAVSKWEKGGSIPDISSLKLLSDYYNIPIDDILKGETSRQNTSGTPNNKNKEIIKITLSVFILIAGLLPFLQTNTVTYNGFQLLVYDAVGLGYITFVFILAFILFQLTFSVFTILRIISFSYSNISLNRSIALLLLVLVWFSITISALEPFPFILFFLYLIAIVLVNTRVLNTLHQEEQTTTKTPPLKPLVYLGTYYTVLSVIPIYLLFFDQGFRTVNLMVYPITILLYLSSVMIFLFSVWRRKTNTTQSRQAELISIHTMRLLYLFFFYLMYTQGEFFNITENSYDSIMYIIIYIGFELFIHSTHTESRKYYN